MKNLLFILLMAISLASCEKDVMTEKQNRTFKIEATGTAFKFELTRRPTGTDKELSQELIPSYTGPYVYEFTPTTGQTYKVTLSGSGLESYRITYKGEEQVSSTKKGGGINKDFVIVD